MRTVIVYVAIIMGLFMLTGLKVSAQATPTLPAAPESLAGLVPGVSTVGDAVNRYGTYDVILPGRVSYLIAGIPASKEYQWSVGHVLGRRALGLETQIGGAVVNLIVVDQYPGLFTSRGLGALMPESAVWQLYGMPDFAYEWRLTDEPVQELFFLNQGLVVVLQQVPGRTNWTVTKLILTYPAYLNNAVALRTRDALTTSHVRDISRSYRVWAQMAYAPRG